MSAYNSIIEGLSGIARYFELGESSAANGVSNGIIDQIGGQDGTTANMATSDFGKTGPVLDDATTAINFNGTNAYITLANTDAVFSQSGAAPFWVIAWVKPNGSGSNYEIISKIGPSSPFPGFRLFLVREGTYGTYRPTLDVLNNVSTGFFSVASNLPNMQAANYGVPTGSWSCVAMQYSPPASGTCGTGNVSFWINGIRLVNQVLTQTYNVANAIANTGVAALGADNAGATFPFNGAMGQVAFGTGNTLNDKIARDVYIQGIGVLSQRAVPTVILSSDVESDVDSYVGEFSAGFAAVRAGLMSMPNADIATVVSSTDKYEAQAVSMEAIYQGVSPIISQRQSGPAGFAPTYTATVAGSGLPSKLTYLTVPESTVTLLAALNSAAPNSLVFVTMGPLTSLAGLLNGGYAAIIYAKVQKLVCVGGAYTSQGSYADSTAEMGMASNAEYNFYSDAASADTVTRLWPTPIDFIDYSVGIGSALPGTNVFSSTLDPKHYAYSYGDVAGRDDWGGVAWLHVVYNESGNGVPGASGKLFTQSATGTNVVNTASNTPNSGIAGYNKFTFANTRNVSVSGVGTVTLSDQYFKPVRGGCYSAWALRWLIEASRVTFRQTSSPQSIVVLVASGAIS